jgi:hypothetical protein
MHRCLHLVNNGRPTVSPLCPPAHPPSPPPHPTDLETTSLADLKIESELPLAVVADTEEEEVDSWRAAGLQHIVSASLRCTAVLLGLCCADAVLPWRGLAWMAVPVAVAVHAGEGSTLQPESSTG